MAPPENHTYKQRVPDTGSINKSCKGLPLKAAEGGGQEAEGGGRAPGRPRPGMRHPEAGAVWPVTADGRPCVRHAYYVKANHNSIICTCHVYMMLYDIVAYNNQTYHNTLHMRRVGQRRLAAGPRPAPHLGGRRGGACKGDCGLALRLLSSLVLVLVLVSSLLLYCYIAMVYH